MKIAYCSDLHLEFDKIFCQYDGLFIKNNDNADILVLVGDIMVLSDIKDYYRKVISDCVSEFKQVLYVMGNHEHYGFDMKLSKEKIQKEFPYDNLHILDNDSIIIDDIKFIGGTMWTTMNNRNPLTMISIPNRMNDYRVIQNDGKKLSIDDIVNECNEFKQYLCSELDGSDMRTVVLTHHSPSMKSIPLVFISDEILNYAYYENMEDMIHDNKNIELWIHGHVHNVNDYMIGSTRILSNPRGYVYHEKISKTFDIKVVEI